MTVQDSAQDQAEPKSPSGASPSIEAGSDDDEKMPALDAPFSAPFEVDMPASFRQDAVPIAGLHYPSRDPSLCGDAEEENDPFRPSTASCYNRYHVPVSREEGDRATKIDLFSFARPHMRAFHAAWISFFLAFMLWFASAPLTPEIADTLGLSKQQIWSSSIANDFAAIILRVVVGPICDTYGARLPMAAVLLMASIPTGMLGLVNSITGLVVTRLMIGIAGSSFVMAQVWPSRMFAREISGTANGIVGGWGNFGGAVAQLAMGTWLFPTFTEVFDGDSERSWRTICIFPAVIAFVWGCIMPFISDDAPLGNYSELRKKGAMDRVFFTTSLRSGAQRNTYILFIQYACSFGVELVMNHAAVLYFRSEFGLKTRDAAALGFVYGSMNLFARGLGGYISDHLYEKYGMRGRLWLNTILLLAMGSTIFLFSYVRRSLLAAVLVMCVFSIFTQAAEGAVYGVVPYVSKLYTGSVAGIVGSGGNVGSVAFGFCFRQLDYTQAFALMGAVVFVSALTSLGIRFPRHAGLITGKDHPSVLHPKRREQHQAEREQQRAHSARITSANSDEEGSNENKSSAKDVSQSALSVNDAEAA